MATLDLPRKLLKAGAYAEAIRSAQSLLQKDNNDVEVYRLLGEAHVALKQFEQAFFAYEAALLLKPEDVYLRFWCGETLFHLAHYAEVVQVLNGMDPGDDAALVIEHAITLGRAQQMIGHTVAAEVNLSKAFMSDPGNENVALNLATFYEQEGLLPQAIDILQAAASRHPHSARLHYNLGTNLTLSGKSEEAQVALEATLNIAPHHITAHHNLGLLHLRRGNLRQGWEHYAWRFNRHALEGAPADWIPHTPRLPNDMQGRTVHIHGEQGIGDELFFLRYLPMLRQRGARLVYNPHNAKLRPILPLVLLDHEHSTASVAPAPITGGSHPAPLHIGDLPLALGEQAAAAYPPPLALHASAEAMAILRNTHSVLRSHRPKIGILWRAGTDGGQTAAGMKRWLQKSVPLDLLLEALAPLDVDLVILQRNVLPEELVQVQACMGADRVLDASAYDNDLEELLALLVQLDGMVGVSNTNVHLFAGLGKTGDILVPAPHEFRWQESGDETPWFPGFRVYRQSYTGDWTPEIYRLAGALHTRFGTRDKLPF